jgi:hypothetical protein
MSLKLLHKLNGNRNGYFRRFLDKYSETPRIAWYPSAGTDFRALLYLHPSYSAHRPLEEEEPAPPDLFLFTDYFPWSSSTFLDNRLVFDDYRTYIVVKEMEMLPDLVFPLDKDIVHFPDGSKATHRVIFMNLKVHSNKLGEFTWPLLYVFSVNEMFCGKCLIPNEAQLSHVIHIRYGGGCGGGGSASGIWIQNVLRKLGCEYFITDNHYYWQNGDLKAAQLFPELGWEDENLLLTPLRKIHSIGWSGHGDVVWNKVSSKIAENTAIKTAKENLVS